MIEEVTEEIEETEDKEEIVAEKGHKEEIEEEASTEGIEEAIEAVKEEVIEEVIEVVKEEVIEVVTEGIAANIMVEMAQIINNRVTIKNKLYRLLVQHLNLKWLQKDKRAGHKCLFSSNMQNSAFVIGR